MKPLRCAEGIDALAILLAARFPAAAEDCAAWMQGPHWGVMTHYLAGWKARGYSLTMSAEE